MSNTAENAFNASTLDAYVSLPYHVRVSQDRWEEEICYMAYHDELPGCKAQGATWQEAVASLNEARRDYIAALLEDGMEVPCPQPDNAPSDVWQIVNSISETKPTDISGLQTQDTQEAAGTR